jgi:ABC-type glutathione transport system ATPase component
MIEDDNAVPLLAVEDLGIEFRTRSGTVSAVDRIGFELRRGETMALVGESGSGKPVTAYAIMGILDAAARITSGQIVFGGLELLQAGDKAVAEIRGRELAIIFQSPRTALNPIWPVGKHIADILLRHGNVTAAQAPGRAIEMLAKVRIPDPGRRARSYPFELSGGMCQRIMIAMALACEPQLLIADEPTTGLDITTQAVIMDLIAELAALQNMATVAEVDQHTVAHVFGDKAGEAGDRVGDAAVIGADDLAQILGIVARRQRRRADQIAEHHRQLAPLGLPGSGCRGCGLGNGLRRVAAQGGDCGQQLAPVADRGHADAD